jgi:hypothetical protein
VQVIRQRNGCPKNVNLDIHLFHAGIPDLFSSDNFHYFLLWRNVQLQAKRWKGVSPPPLWLPQRDNSRKGATLSSLSAGAAWGDRLMSPPPFIPASWISYQWKRNSPEPYFKSQLCIYQKKSHNSDMLRRGFQLSTWLRWLPLFLTVHPRQISDDDNLKNSLPAVPLKKALSGVLSYPDNFLVHGDRTESNPICFLQIMNSILLYG